MGTELCGFGPYLERKSEAVLENLYARTCIFKLGRTRLALVELDLVGILRPMTVEIRQRVARKTGIPAKNVMLCTTHTHSGPNTIAGVAWGEPNREYLRKLPGLVARGVVEADRDYRPARLSYANVHVKGLSYNRVVKGGRVDKRLAVIRIDVGDRLAGFIAHTSAHPVVLCASSRYICGDFVGVAVNAVARDFPGSVGFFIQGACGDINVLDPHRPVEEALGILRRRARVLADRIRDGLDRARPGRVNRLKSVSRSITLPQVRPGDWQVVLVNELTRLMIDSEGCSTDVRNWGRFLREANNAIIRKLKRGDKAGLRTEIQGFALGEVLILAHPSELFFTFYDQMRKQLKNRKFLLAGYANDLVGYIPDRTSYDITALPSDKPFGYYAPYIVPLILQTYPFRPDAGSYLVGKLLDAAAALT